MLDSGTGVDDGVDAVGILKMFRDCDNAEEVRLGRADDGGMPFLT
jgi:hypothetical protein